MSNPKFYMVRLDEGTNTILERNASDWRMNKTSYLKKLIVEDEKARQAALSTIGTALGLGSSEKEAL